MWHQFHVWLDASTWHWAMIEIGGAVLLILLMYVFMFRSKKGQEKKRQDLIAALKKGDEVQTIGGEFGRVMETRDDRILVKVDESSNTKIWYARSAIHKVVGAADKAEAK